MSDAQRAIGVKNAIQTIEKQFGKGTVMRLGDRPALQVETVSTGCLSLDLALGVGGLPRGRIVEVYGPESSGKTTLALHALAQAQAAGGICAFIDAEHALDPKYAANLGVKVEDLLISQPDNGEQALEIADVLTRSGGIDLLVVDSVAALTPRAELEGDMGDSHVGLQARLMSQALRKLTAAVSRTQAIVLFINQLRQKIGVMFGSNEVTTGGNALKFYSSVRLDIRRIGKIKKGEEQVGNRTRIKVVKNKVAPPFRSVEVDIYYGKGIPAPADLLEIGLKTGQIIKSGSFYSAGDERLAQGKDAAWKVLEERADLCHAIRARALEAAGIPDASRPQGPPAPPASKAPPPGPTAKGNGAAATMEARP